MSASIGDGMTAFAIAGGIVGYLYLKHRTSQKRIEVIHQERMAAMEKGIPLPEFPLDPVPANRPKDNTVLPILGIVLLTLSIGTMIALCFNPQARSHGVWIAPLPFAFLGVGLFAFHFLQSRPPR
jgi:hypothetical protein